MPTQADSGHASTSPGFFGHGRPLTASFYFSLIQQGQKSSDTHTTAKLILWWHLCAHSRDLHEDPGCLRKGPLSMAGGKADVGSGCLRITQSPPGGPHFLSLGILPWTNLQRVRSSPHLLPNTLTPGASLSESFRQWPSGSDHFPHKLTVASQQFEGNRGQILRVDLFWPPEQQFPLVQAKTLTALPTFLHVSVGPGVHHDKNPDGGLVHLGFHLTSALRLRER